MSNNTQRRIQETINQNNINHAQLSITPHSSQFLFTYSNHTQSLVFRGLSPHNNI